MHENEFVFVMGALLCAISLVCFCSNYMHIYCFSISRYQIPEEWPYQEARRLFKEPVALSDEEQVEIKWTAPDEEVNDLPVDSFYMMMYLFDSCMAKYLNRLLVFTGTDCIFGE